MACSQVMRALLTANVQASASRGTSKPETSITLLVRVLRIPKPVTSHPAGSMNWNVSMDILLLALLGLLGAALQLESSMEHARYSTVGALCGQPEKILPALQ